MQSRTKCLPKMPVVLICSAVLVAAVLLTAIPMGAQTIKIKLVPTP